MLLEMVCAIAMVALLVAIVLPRIAAGTSRPRLQAYAVETAALLKADRNAAMRHRGAVAAEVDAVGRTIRSGSSDRTVRVPEDVALDALLPERCDGRPAVSSISFFATGMSCGGTIRFTRLRNWFEVRVNWLTGGIEIVARDAL
jgi:general secretion pathway protein H